MEFYDEKIKALAIEIYELDAEVYKKLGSSLGRVFGGEKDICIRNIMEICTQGRTAQESEASLP